MKSLADEHKLGSSADLGVNFHYRFSDFVNADFSMMNGEGYNSIQMDDVFKYSIGATMGTVRKFISRISCDFTTNKVTETTLVLFASWYITGKWNVAGEWITRANDGWQQDKNITGYSLYTKYDMNAKYQLFARFDKIGSNILEGGTTPWHPYR